MKKLKTPKIAQRWVYFFAPGQVSQVPPNPRALLGNKAAGLMEMSRFGIPVPPGFVITTAACREYYAGGQRVPEGLDAEMLANLMKLERVTGRGFGDPGRPLLVSVRSGAPVSMPGMMDTILNVGLNDRTVVGLARATDNPRFAYDCYRRLIMMWGATVLGISKDAFERVMDALKKKRGVTKDIELDAEDVKTLVVEYKKVFKREADRDFPQDPLEQLRGARDAVFRSWMNERAITYRKLYHIPHDLGTAVTVQMMVFGNMGDTSGTGVGFTRDPATGEDRFYGEFLTNAQGEDVVAGVRTPESIEVLRYKIPSAYQQLREVTKRLEKTYRDVQDFEFTVESGNLYLLQTRTGKRTGFAALRIAVDMVSEKLITPKEAVMRVTCEHLNTVLHPVFDPEKRRNFPVIARGLNASPGAAAGRAIFDPDEAVERASKGERVILVRPETSAEDIHGMARAEGILTSKGGFTSHAAVVARQMGKPSVVGCESIQCDGVRGYFRVGTTIVRKGDYISIDGTTGEVMAGDVPTRESEIIRVLRGELEANQSRLYQDFALFMEWVDKFRRLRVRANADIPADAALAVKFGAEGIGLCRTEHMFFAEDRLPIMREMILASDEASRRAALRKLLPLQTSDFEGLFEIMAGRPVTIRTIDPPLHEFLPSHEELQLKIQELRLKKGPRSRIAELEALLQRVNELREFNPMMGHRGCRLGITMPEITEMQAEAIFEAALRVARKRGKAVVPEIMIPVVAEAREFQNQKEIVDRVAREVFKRRGKSVPYLVGTMIEVPRAALTAAELARTAEFFSFGTNDLTQTTFGFSRDDAGKFLPFYLDKGILDKDPFVTIDAPGVGQLIQMAVAAGRRTRPALKVGICGEHGGEEHSVKFCHRAGLDYVSCSPYRIPLARLAAAQAAIAEEGPSG